jgi:hypothetical protein
VTGGRAIRRRLVPAWNGLRLALSHPTAVFDRARTFVELRRLAKEARPASDHAVETRWPEALHELLATPYPCEAAREFPERWAAIQAGVSTDAGWIGPEFDADANLASAVWCTVRHLRPRRVVETGVARGVTSRIVLEALARNGRGHLWSIDLPKLGAVAQAGSAVPAHLRGHWAYFVGASARRLPPLVDQLGHVDLFIHDSLHTERNVRFELETVWPALSEAGVVLVDDIDDRVAYGSGRAFAAFVRAREETRWLVAPQDQKAGCFGVIARLPPGAGSAAQDE